MANVSFCRLLVVFVKATKSKDQQKEQTCVEN